MEGKEDLFTRGYYFSALLWKLGIDEQENGKVKN